jgi:hypothetical protein
LTLLTTDKIRSFFDKHGAGACSIGMGNAKEGVDLPAAAAYTKRSRILRSRTHIA